MQCVPDLGRDLTTHWASLSTDTWRIFIVCFEGGHTGGVPDDPTPGPWPFNRVASEIDRSPEALKSLRKRGRFPAPDGRLGRAPWWHADTVQRWLASQQPPPGAVVGRQAAARTLGISLAQLISHELPPGDGTHRGHTWWRPDTLRDWVGTAFANELVNLEGFRELMGCSDAEWDQLHFTLPDPYLTGPPRWWARQARVRVRARGAQLRACRDILFVRDIPAVAGLAQDSVRRYRWEGRLPDPDGFHRGRPWWHRRTISTWDQMRNRDHTPLRHRI